MNQKFESFINCLTETFKDMSEPVELKFTRGKQNPNQPWRLHGLNSASAQLEKTVAEYLHLFHMDKTGTDPSTVKTYYEESEEIISQICKNLDVEIPTVEFLG